MDSKRKSYTAEYKLKAVLESMQRLARNARPIIVPSLTITIHGLSASFADIYAFGLLAAV